MKNYYDKVLFILALVLLGLGVAYFFMKGGLPSGALPAVASQPPGGGAYAAVPASTAHPADVSWDAGPDEYPADPDLIQQWKDAHKDTQPTPAYPTADLWYYGVFTPPKIWWDPVAGWTALSPKPPKAVPPFALHLEGKKQRLYRIQFHGYLGAEDKSAVLQLADTENKKYFNIRVGVDKPDEGVKVTDFKVMHKQGPGGRLYREGVLTLLDERTNQTLTLTENQPLYLPNDMYMLLETDSPLPTQTWEVTKTGETLDVGDVNFKITKVDFDAPSVTVLRTEPLQKDTQEQTLTPTTPPPAAPASGDATSQPNPAPTAAPALPTPM